ncbi:MAG: DUF983 domain-containing protein [Crocinitomicaceae bacterium]|nr:DUF983 domain-containing protein [Crocinitomicaceae bacterium]
MKKPSLTRSVFGLRCPRCREGRMFKKQGLLVYSDMLGMKERCSCCNLNYTIEPGFWLGALWTSYPIVILIEVPFLIAALLIDGPGMWIAFIGMLVAFFIAWPLMLRLGRSFWIHINVRYDESYIK